MKRAPLAERTDPLCGEQVTERHDRDEESELETIAADEVARMTAANLQGEFADVVVTADLI